MVSGLNEGMLSVREIRRKVLECKNLQGRLNRYWGKLVKESLKKAQRENIETVISERGEVGEEKGVVIIRSGEEVDVSELIRLVKNDYPSLYRRYHEGLSKYKLLRAQLRQIYN
jgi:hypothetical protein